MRLGRRLQKLEQVLAPPPPACDCPSPTFHYELTSGVVYPPEPPCLRGRCPDAGRRAVAGEQPRIMKIVMSRTHLRGPNGEPGGWPLSVRSFEQYDPETGQPRVRVIVWRDEAGRLRYHGPPRWWELGIESPRFVRAANVTESDAAIVEELRRTDDTPELAMLLGAKADQGAEVEQE